MEDLLRNLGAYFSRSASRQNKLREFQEHFQVKVHKIKLISQTRWLALEGCVQRVLEQYEPLLAYLTETVFSDPSRTTEDMISTMQNKFTKIYLEFMSYILGILNDFNTLFQTESPLLYKLKPETENILKTLCSNYIKISIIQQTKDIFKLNHQDPHLFEEIENIYLGLAATESLNSIKQSASKDEILLFLKTCLNFYIELISEIKKRFKFEDELFSIIEVVNPLKAKTYEIKSLMGVFQRFPILKEHVNIQQVDNEWKTHALLDFKNYDLNFENAEEYWLKIFSLKNSANMPIFANLKIVISFLLILPFSNATVERLFSKLNDIVTDCRSNLVSSTINAILHTNEGINACGGILTFEPDKKCFMQIYGKIVFSST